MWMPAGLLAAALTLALGPPSGWRPGPGPTSAFALANSETEEQRISRALQATLEKHGGEVNRCFELALADSLDVSGKVELSMDVGEGGKVTRAVPLEHTATSPVLLTCLSTSAAEWVIPEVAAGSTVVVPLAFEGQMAQFSVKAADAPERGPASAVGRPGHGRAKAGTGKGLPAFSVKVLVDEATMRAQQASLSLLTLAPASRIAMHRHPGDELLFVRKGRARLLGPSGVNPEILTEGTAALIPAGMPHVIENMVRSASVELIQIFAPLGPERVYRDPTDARGRAAFEIIRDPRQAVRPPGAAFAVESAATAAGRPLPGATGKMRQRILVDPAHGGSERVSLFLLEGEPGAEVPRHAHDDSAEILYVLSGAGHLDIGSERLPYAADQAIHLPARQPHAIHVAGNDKSVFLQVFAPAASGTSAAKGQPRAQDPHEGP
jgi:quercetin dioxygenase-like cupin family protein